jgi:hydrogenase/urease accessory protein HupE
MARNRVDVTNFHTGKRVRTYQGFSWTTFFWGMWPAVFRRDWLGVLVAVGLWMLLGFGSFVMAELAVSMDPYGINPNVGLGLPLISQVVGLAGWIVYSASYNRWHYNRAIAKGYQPVLAY